MKYSENDIKAGLTLCNFGGLVILDIVNGLNDYIISAFSFGDGLENISKCKIRENASGRSYFIKQGRRYYLDQFTRV